jgi:hypothetical protein
MGTIHARLRRELSNLLGQQQKDDRPRYKHSDDYDALLADAKGIPFWIEREDHESIRRDHRLDRGNSNCCFWDLLGRPIKHGENPVFDYQQIILRALEFFLKIRIKKFRGAGSTEQLLRYPAWLALSTNEFRKNEAMIITGINQDLANEHIRRLKNMIEVNYPRATDSMEYTQKTITLNDSIFRAYPQANPQAPRGKTNVFYVLADEFDFPTRRVQEDMMEVITPFRPKEDALIVLNSTTKRTNGLYREMDQNWSEFLQNLGLSRALVNPRDLLLADADKPEYLYTIKRESKYRYYLLEFDVSWGIGKIYTLAEIDEVKEDRTYPGEYLLVYAGVIGNVFPWEDIEEAFVLGEELKDIPINPHCFHFAGIDPGWAKITPVYVWEVMDDFECARLIHVELFDRSKPETVADWCREYSNKPELMNLWYILDGSDRGFVNTMKSRFEEDETWQSVKEVSPRTNKVIPVNFKAEHSAMLENLFLLMSGKHIAMPRHLGGRLEEALKSAWAEKWDLDKDETDKDDDLDCTRMALRAVKFGGLRA